jgi:hypothetical protein
LVGAFTDPAEAYNTMVAALGAAPGLGTPGNAQYVGDIVLQVAASRGVNLQGFFNPVNDPAAILQALQNGYALIVNGHVVGDPNAPHFAAVKGLNPDGTLNMADPWLPEFANRPTSLAQFMQFAQGGNNPPGFFAFKPA